MFYEIRNEIKVIPYDEIDQNSITVGVMAVDEFEGLFSHTGYSDITLEQCHKENTSKRNSIDRYDNYYFGMLNILDYDNVFDERSRVAFYIKKNELTLIKIIERNDIVTNIIADTFERFVPDKINFERLIYAFLDRVLNKDKNKAEYYEKSIEHLESRVGSGDTSKDIAAKIATTKKILSEIKKFYDQLSEIGEVLVENELGVFNHKEHSSIELFTAKARRQSATIQQLIDNLNQVKDSYQALLDHSINQTMKVFTIITAIFMPMTLLVGWYGMNFQGMPELSWDYGYVGFIVVSFAIVVTLFIIFKKKKFF